jgi:hypothetical protein
VFPQANLAPMRSAAATLNPDEDPGAGDEVITLGDAGAPDSGAPVGGARDAGPPDAGGGDAGPPDTGTAPVAPPTQRCSIVSGPAYTPSGTIPVTNAGGRKTAATFNLGASFHSAGTGVSPACCSVRQYIKWNTAFHNWSGGPPHAGFPSSAPANTWIEDRNDTNTRRYGYRTGPFAVPLSPCRNEYKTGTTLDMANGDTYCGRDRPSGPTSMVGQFKFRLDVIDTCSGAAAVSSPEITINW